MGDDKNFRHRFTVPADDTIVNGWIDKQANLAFSIRVLIRNFVKTYGNEDATCVEFGEAPKRRGRPPKQLKEMMGQMNSGQIVQDAQYDNDEDYSYDADDYESLGGAPVENTRNVSAVRQPKAVVQPQQQVRQPVRQNNDSGNTGQPSQIMNILHNNKDYSSGAGEVPMSSDGTVDLDALMGNG